MTTYNCKIVVLSTYTFENTPIIYEYVEKHSGVTYIETSNFILQYEKNNINVEIKQIATSIHMLEFIKINVEYADFIVIFDAKIGIIPDSIFALVKSKRFLKIDDHSNYRNVINNKIFNLIQLDLLDQVKFDEQLPVDNKTTTIFGKTNNQRLIRIDNWLDKWLFCCC